MKPLVLAGMAALSLLCTACASHRIARGPVGAGAGGRADAAAPAARPDDVRAGGFGASDSKKKGNDLLLSDMPGTAADNHSELQSKTPDGGRSLQESLTPKPPTTATLVVEGVDTPGAEIDRRAKGQAAIDLAATDKAAADKAGSDESADAKTNPVYDRGFAAQVQSKPANPTRPIDGSDPSVAAPSERLSKLHRKVT